MGIRFHCPNGHKLNVKSFLAGKKGVCPDCGAKFRIPPHSEPGLGSDEPDDQPVAAASNPAPSAAVTKPIAPVASPAPAAVATAAPTAYAQPVRPAAVPVAAVPMQAMPMGAVPSGLPLPQMRPGPQPMTSAAPPYAVPAHAMPAHTMPTPPPPMAAAGMGPRDPIAENPLATWFVRPPSGGQFGPARGEVMRKWLTEGRVTADSLVWREGWTDWLAATEVFPALGNAAAAMFGSPASPSRSNATAAVAGRKKSSGALGTAILVLLAIICVILAVVFAVVVSTSGAAT